MSKPNSIAVYPGSFDPITLGHLDIIERGAQLFERLVVAVAVNIEKQCLFSPKERIHFLQVATGGWPNVEICAMDGLLVDFADQIRAGSVLRGLRAVSDFEVEFQMAAMNRKLNPRVETIFLMSGEHTTFLSSRLVKEIASMGGDITPFVPPVVIPELHARMAGKGRQKNR